jgi:hypothetical protein
MTDARTSDDSPNATTRWPVIAGVVVILAALGAALFLFGGGDDETDSTVDSTATTEVAESTSPETSPPTTAGPETTPAPATTEAIDTTTPATTPAPPLPDPTASAIWPWVATSIRYDDPVEAASGFAVDFLDFENPISSEFMAGDNRSGEVQIRAIETGPVTTVFVRQLTDDDSWWIIGAAGENITIDGPPTGSEITSPLTVTGTALAFEGTVDVELIVDGNGEPIVEGFVTGGAIEPGPFSGTFEFASPGPSGGALVLYTTSDEIDATWEASVIRVIYP